MIQFIESIFRNLSLWGLPVLMAITGIIEFALGLYENKWNKNERTLDIVCFVVPKVLIKPVIVYFTLLVLPVLLPGYKGVFSWVPFWWGFFIIAVADDLTQYWYHRLHHQVPWLWRSAVAAVATALIVMIAIPGGSGNSIERQMVDNHLRSMLADHLVDVPSSDQHTVKPWFQGKLNFAPSVPDLTADGFTLIGGRLDVVGGRPAAAIVYRRRQHVVNLWILAADGAPGQLKSSDVEGFHLLQWGKGGMAYWAVSDLNPVELREFAMLIRAH